MLTFFKGAIMATQLLSVQTKKISYQAIVDADRPSASLIVSSPHPIGCFGRKEVKRVRFDAVHLQPFLIATGGCCTRKFTILLNGKPTAVQLNVNSLVTRLGVTKKGVERAASEDDLISLFAFKLFERGIRETAVYLSKTFFQCNSTMYISPTFVARKINKTVARGTFAKIKEVEMIEPQGLPKAVRRIVHLTDIKTNFSETFQYFGRPCVIPSFGWMQYTTSRGVKKIVSLHPREDFNLFNMIKNNTFISAETQLSLGEQIFTAIESIEGAHRDIKPDNFLVYGPADNPKLWMIDLDMRVGFKQDEKQLRCGSPLWVSPEMFEPKKHDIEKIDVWPAALILILILTLPNYIAAPWFYLKIDNGNRHQKKVDQFLAEATPHILRAQPKLGKSICDLLCKMLVTDPERRISIQHAIAEYRQILASSSKL